MLDDRAARFLPPGPDSFDEGILAEGVAVSPFVGELLLDYVLGGYSGMVGAGHPEDIVPLHPLPPRQDVLERVVEGVAHVERAGYVGWGDDDGKGRSARVDVSVK